MLIIYKTAYFPINCNYKVDELWSAFSRVLMGGGGGGGILKMTVYARHNKDKCQRHVTMNKLTMFYNEIIIRNIINAKINSRLIYLGHSR